MIGSACFFAYDQGEKLKEKPADEIISVPEAAVVCYFVGGKSLYFLPTMSKVAFKSWHFDADQLANLKQIVVAGKFDAGIPSPKEIGNVRMDALLAEDNTFGAIQLYKYVDLMYEPQMEVRVLNISEVEALTQILKK